MTNLRWTGRLLLILAVTVGGGVARAGDLVRDVRAGDEVEGVLAAGDTHTFRIPLVVGTELELSLKTEAGGGSDPGKDDDGGPAPTLTLRDPAGVQLAVDTASRAKIKTTAAVTGIFVAEIEAGSFKGTYELEFEVEFSGSVGGGGGTTNGEPVTVHLDVPLGASVKIDVRRRAGGSPELVAVRDGAGRVLDFRVKKAKSSRVVTFPIAVTAPGGMFVDVASSDGGTGTYDVFAKLSDDDDDSPGEEGEHEEGEIVLHLAPDADVAAILAELSEYEEEDRYPGILVLEVPDELVGQEARATQEAIARTAQFGVLGGETNELSEVPEGSHSNALVLGSDLGRAQFDRQNAFQQIRLPAAHTRVTGDGIVVAVLDTGIDRTHSLFTGRVLPGADFVDADGVPDEEANGLDEDNDLQIDEGFGHGTFVAGLVLGVAPDAMILPIRVLDTEGRGKASNIAAGVFEAVAQGADVINLSMGGRSRSDVLLGAVKYAREQGVLVVAATGNRGNTLKIDFPSGVTGVLSVTAVDARRVRAPFANVGRQTSVAAPGTDVIGPYPDERWGTWSGTSFSAAVTSGVAALVHERVPTATVSKVVRRITRRSRRPRGSRKSRRLLGGGIVDAAKAVR